jgi:hypothetical protein
LVGGLGGYLKASALIRTVVVFGLIFSRRAGDIQLNMIGLGQIFLLGNVRLDRV